MMYFVFDFLLKLFDYVFVSVKPSPKTNIECNDQSRQRSRHNCLLSFNIK